MFILNAHRAAAVPRPRDTALLTRIATGLRSLPETIRRRLVLRNTIDELQSLSDRELQGIGLTRTSLNAALRADRLSRRG